MSFQIVLLSALAVAAILATPAGMSAQGGAAERGFGVADSKVVAGRDFVGGEVIVGLHRGMPDAAADAMATAAAGRVARRLGGPDPVALMRFGDEPRAQQAIAALVKEPGVRFVERNGIVRVPPMPAAALKDGRRSRRDVRGLVVSADPGTQHQWHLTVIRKTAALGTLSAAPPTIAIIDTGVDYTHSELSGKVIKGKNCVDDTMDPFDDHGHGTHVAGIAAAKSGNAIAGEGVSRNSKILAVKVLDSTGFGTFFDIVCGMRYARTAVTSPATRIGNLSIGGPTSVSLAAEVDNWKTAGKVLVVAAGNGNDTGSGTFNVDSDFAFRVMATEENDCRASFSSFSPASAPDRFNIAAPGYDILSTMPDEGFGMMNGTSMAAPMVAGAAALVWGQAPALTREAIVTRLVETGKPITCGFAAATRRVDVRKALLQTPEIAIVGRVLDGVSGQSTASVTPSVQAIDDGTLLGSDVANHGGSYELIGARLAGSGRKLKVTAPGYIADTALRSPITVSTSSPTGPFTDVVVQQRGAGFFQVTLDWNTAQPDTATAGDNTIGWDLDLVLQPPGVNDTWVGPGPDGDLATEPFYRLFRDSFDDNEPVEALAIAPAATNGTYRIIVQRFAGPERLGLNASRGHVRFYDGNAAVMASRAVSCTAAQPFWHVANVRKVGATYTITRVDLCRANVP